MSPALVTYIPVLHEGYRLLFARHPEARALYIFGKEVIGTYEQLVKDIRKLDPELVKQAITAWGLFDRVEILDEAAIQQLQHNKTALIVSDDDLSTELVSRYFSGQPVEQDTIFLRWDKKTAIEPLAVSPDVTISSAEFDQQMIATAKEEGTHSPDWWRRIGALAVKDGQVLFQVHNQYVPSDQTAYDQGDPRGNFKSGVHLESALAIHAEAQLVALAARDGVSLQGADVYSETFPCPPCAKFLAYTGIKRLYYQTGYKVLDGESILKNHGIEIVFVEPKV